MDTGNASQNNDNQSISIQGFYGFHIPFSLPCIDVFLRKVYIHLIYLYYSNLVQTTDGHCMELTQTQSKYLAELKDQIDDMIFNIDDMTRTCNMLELAYYTMIHSVYELE